MFVQATKKIVFVERHWLGFKIYLLYNRSSLYSVGMAAVFFFFCLLSVAVVFFALFCLFFFFSFYFFSPDFIWIIPESAHLLTVYTQTTIGYPKLSMRGENSVFGGSILSSHDLFQITWSRNILFSQQICHHFYSSLNFCVPQKFFM